MLKYLALLKNLNAPLPKHGMKVLANVLPIDRRLFDPHTIKGFYVGVWMEHNRCFKIFIPSTVRVRIADTVIWSPHVSLKIPIPIKDEILRRAIDDLRTTIQLSLKNNILTPEGTTSRKPCLNLMTYSIIKTYVIPLPNFQLPPTFQGWNFNQRIPL